MSDGAAPEQSSPSLVGQVLDGRYRLVKKLGEGGMGEVYAAEHVHIDKRFAIKLLKPEIVSNQEAVKRFYQEARSSSSIGHRNIIAIEDFGTLSDGRVYMCMELLNGAPLNDMLQTRMPVDRLLNILIQTGHGLAAAHAKGIVHRDMKPENVYVTVGPNGEDIPKLLDFGIAKVSGNDGQNHLTRTGTIFGTPFYMAPEQALGNPVDQRTDIYAVGVIMYEVFAGSLPFQGESFMGILTQHITTDPEPVQQRAAKAGREITPALADIIMRCTRKNPAERYNSMDELVAALVGVYRSMSGAGMSTYMEAFNHTGQNTPGPMTGMQASASGQGSAQIGVPPTGAFATGGGMQSSGQNPLVGQSQPMPPQQGIQGGFPGMGPPVGAAQSGPVGALATSGSQSLGNGLYDPSTAKVSEAKKGGGKGLIIALVILVVLGGAGAAVYFLVIAKANKLGEGLGSGIAMINDDLGKGSGSTDPKAVGSDPKTVDPKANGGGSGDVKAVDPKNTTPPVDAPAAENPPPAIDAAAETPPPPTTQMDRVILTSTNVRSFEVWADDKKLGDGPMEVEVPKGGKRIVTIKAKGYKDRQMLVTDKGPVQFPMDRVGGVTPPTPPDTHKHPDPPNPPQTNKIDCRAIIVDPKNAACRDQYCKLHASDIRCQAE